MSRHYREQLREAVVDLVSHLETSRGNVFSGRGKAIPASRLPALRVRPLAETSQRHAGGKASGENPLLRTLELGVTAMAAGADFDDVLDKMASEVEVAVGADPTLDGLVIDSFLSRTEFDEYAAGDNPAGQLMLVYRLTYRTKINAPQSAV